jgi:Spy/CpxP family protein refolding chaperone
MKRYRLYTILTLSLLLNAAVVLTVGYRALASGVLPGTVRSATQEPVYLADDLDLTEAQRSPWRTQARAFGAEMDALWRQAAGRRERMIREVFSPSPDAAVVEAERAAMAGLQERMQQLVIAHMREEREMLTEVQRDRLVGLLIAHGSRTNRLWGPPHAD